MKDTKKKEHPQHAKDAQDMKPSPARKKRKVGEREAVPETMPSPVRHEKLWFDDGNVVIVADDLTFKVHRSVLTQHSIIVTTLEKGDTHEILDDSHEDCPIFRTDDCSTDFARLLLIMYGQDRLFFDRRVSIKFPDLRGVTLLAQKYDVRAILDEASARLRAAFPADLGSENIWSEPLHYLQESPDNPVHCTEADTVAAAELATRLDLPSVRVMALYHCCRLEPAVLYDGAEYGGARVQLAPADLRLCAHATRRLLEANTRVMSCIATMLMDPDEFPRERACTHAERCASAFRTMVLEGIMHECFAMPAPLDLLDTWIDEETDVDGTQFFGMCPPCNAVLKAAVNGRRQEALEELGLIFGVRPWPPAAEIEQSDIVDSR